MPGATFTVSVPAVHGSPRHRHNALRCMVDSLSVYLLPCQMTEPYSIKGRTMVTYRRIMRSSH